jgi:hypothetical protein
VHLLSTVGALILHGFLQVCRALTACAIKLFGLLVRAYRIVKSFIGRLLNWQVPDYTRVGLWLQVILLWFSILWLYVLPIVPGEAVVALGILAICVTVRPDSSIPERVVWVGIAVFLMVLEFGAITNDRAASDAKYFADRQRQTVEFNDMMGHFFSIFNQGKENLNATVTKADGVLKATKEVASLAKENLENITGGDTYAYVVPETFGVNSKGQLPFWIYSKGKNVLTGVSVQFVSVYGNSGTGDHVQEIKDTPTEEVGTLHGGQARMLKTTITPLAGLRLVPPDGVDWYILTIYSQNFTVNESLEIRKGKYLLPWAYQLNINRQVTIPCPKGEQPSGPNQDCRRPRLLEFRRWSDDRGEGMPDPRP